MSGTVDPSDLTCWAMIQGAADGDAAHREAFARRYEPPVRAYLAARWRQSPHLQSIDDAVQEVFVDCLREGGALGRITGNRKSSFRAFLYAVVGNVALRVEDRYSRNRERQAPEDLDPAALRAYEAHLSAVFDRAWAQRMVREAVERQRARAARLGADAERRVALLYRRFYDNLPICEIAREWETDAAFLHHEYARARGEFRTALLDVVSAHHPGSPGEVEEECKLLLNLLRD